jgi:hypothetical protein
VAKSNEHRLLLPFAGWLLLPLVSYACSGTSEPLPLTDANPVIDQSVADATIGADVTVSDGKDDATASNDAADAGVDPGDARDATADANDATGDTGLDAEGEAVDVESPDGGGHGLPVTATVGPSGGAVEGPHGASVTIPEGALSDAVTVTIAEDSTSAPAVPAQFLTVGPVFEFTPHRAQFAVPVTIRVPFDPSTLPPNTTPILIQAEPGGTFTRVPAQVDNTTLVAMVSSFSWMVGVRFGKIASGWNGSCALVWSGGVQCWGDNSEGQLGQLDDVSLTDSSTPVYVKGLPTLLNTVPNIQPSLMRDLATFDNYTCALVGRQGPWCWGYVPYDHPGTPVNVPGLELASAITVGVTQSCALLPGGVVKCWGPGTTDAANVVAVPGLTGAVAISSGGSHSCALMENGKVECWGSNTSGQLGDNTWRDSSATPVAVWGLSGVLAISAGWRETCAILSDHTAACWGEGAEQFGFDQNHPVAVPGLTNVVGISTYLGDTCAVLTDKTTRCWGGINNSLMPSDVLGLTGVVTVSVGYNHVCAALEDGTARCYGHNDYGQRGDDSPIGPDGVHLGGKVDLW